MTISRRMLLAGSTAAALAQAQAAVTTAGEAVHATNATAREAAAALPALREAEAQARTALERHRIDQGQAGQGRHLGIFAGRRR